MLLRKWKLIFRVVPLFPDAKLRCSDSLPSCVHFSASTPELRRHSLPVTEQTQVWLCCDERNIYVSARLHDSAPEREIITEMRRDGQGTNDNESFGVVFDTFHDRRNGFLFQVIAPSS